MIMDHNIFNWFLFLLIHLQTIASRSVNGNCNIFNKGRLKCYGYFQNDTYLSDVIELQMKNISVDSLDMNDILYRFPDIKRVFVEKSDIVSIIPPKNTNKIELLSLRFNKLNSLPEDFIQHFPNLKVLKLENNQLVNLEKHFNTGTLEKLYLKNNPWSCSLDLSWSLELNKTIAKDINNITCNRKYPGKRLLVIAKYIEGMYQNCTFLCDCSLENVVQDPRTDKQYPIIMVNCTGRGFRELPTQLPLYTRILHLERNEITNLRPLITNPIFKSIWDLYLDNNTVDTISYLEGSYWLQHFRVFSLRGNHLQKLPAFALDNALMKNPNMPGALLLYLGNNPWRCDCIFVPVFQELVLQKYSNMIADINDVKCKYVEGDENSLLPIISLTRSSVCMVPTDFSLQEGLDVLNAVLASLILFILGKLVYDYYNFKKYGRLPWIVTKMP